MECSCCGEEREEDQLASLVCDEDVRLCRGCIGWMRGRAGVPDSTPILPVRDIDEAKAFYESAGFDVRVYEGGGHAFVEYEDESVFDLGLPEAFEPKANRAGCYLIVPGVEHWHAKLVDAALPVSELADQPWGMREFALTDPSGNHVRVGRPIDS